MTPGLGIKSADLSDATYNIPFEILEANASWLKDVFADNPIVEVFGDLLDHFEREVDPTDLFNQGLWPNSDRFTTVCGSFMGDVMSFAHLTLYHKVVTLIAKQQSEQVSITKAAHDKDFVNVTGDDLINLLATPEWDHEYNRIIDSTGGKRSKIDAYSPRTGTYCEQWVVRLTTDERKYYASQAEYKDSLFGDLLFLDIIKGSLLTNQSKVKNNGTSPFIGHAKMAYRQLRWHPKSWVRQRVPKLLWALNYIEARMVSRSHAYFPPWLGGIDIPLQKYLKDDLRHPDNDLVISNYLIYLLPIVDKSVDVVETLEVEALLHNLQTGSNKGTKFDNNLDKIVEILENSKVKSLAEVINLEPDWVKKIPWYKQYRYFEEKYSMISTRELNSLLNNLKSIQEVWQSESPIARPIKRQALRNLERRFGSAWKQIRSKYPPKDIVEAKNRVLELGTIKNFEKKINDRTWELMIPSDSLALRESLLGLGPLSVVFA